MICQVQINLEQELELVRAELRRSHTQELKQKEDILCVAIKDHKMVYNSELLEFGCGPWQG
jgi:hypothetical protein